LQYENERAMFEAFSRNRATSSTGLIQWMLDNAWPSLHWNLFDWYLEPNGSTFGAMEANRPLHVLYGYDDRSVSVTNDTTHASGSITVHADVFDTSGRHVWSASTETSVPQDGVRTVLRLPAASALPDLYFLRLELESGGLPLDRNTYWLARTMDTSDFAHSQWYVTPTSTYVDMRALQDLSVAQPQIGSCTDGRGEGRVDVRNRTDHVVFFLRLRLTTADGANVPTRWGAGDVTLMPGESRAVGFHIDPATPIDGLRLSASGWNTPASTTAVGGCFP